MRKVNFFGTCAPLWGLILLLGILISITGCGSSGGGSSNKKPVSKIGLPSHIFDDPVSSEKKWNFLVYLDGDNNLEPAAIADINEMEVVGSNGDLNILVLIDRHPGYDYSNGNWTGTRLYKVTKDSNGLNGQVVSKLLYDFGELDLSHPNTLRDFVRYCQEKYPAEKSVLTLWDHGEGIYPRSLSAKPKDNELGTKGICFDDTTGFSEWTVLTTDEIAKALTEAESQTGEGIDIINMDACLMQMIEVAYELRNTADYLVGSEENVPGPGNKYDTLLDRLASNPNQTAGDFASALVEDYYEYYNRYTSEHTTYSALSLGSDFDNLILAFKAFATELNSVADTSILQAKSNAVSFNSGQFVDLYGFTDNINEIEISSASDLIGALGNCIIHYKGTGIYDYTGLYGLSIFMPDSNEWALSSSSERYRALEFCSDTSWDELLSKLTGLAPQLLSVRIMWPYGDCDLGIKEPNDNSIYTIDRFTQTPNGLFSQDRGNGGEESWVINAVHDGGIYTPLIRSWNYSGAVVVTIETEVGVSSFNLNVNEGYEYHLESLQVNSTRGLGVTYDLRVEKINSIKK